MSLKIRKATLKDINKLVDLQNGIESYYNQWRKTPQIISPSRTKKEILRDGFGKNKCYKTYIAFWNKEPAGFFCYHNGYRMENPPFKVFYLIDLFVYEKMRRNKIGLSLMQFLSELAKKENAKQILWTVWKPNKKAVNFYKKLGADFLEKTDNEKLMVWDV